MSATPQELDDLISQFLAGAISPIQFVLSYQAEFHKSDTRIPKDLWPVYDKLFCDAEIHSDNPSLLAEFPENYINLEEFRRRVTEIAKRLGLSG
ncbi:MAG: hypothetical protein Q8R02_06765 [Hyphomonadaceae bacterium]|nr:hypothetical protein [Hyphomonadaceae bacterium]